MVTAFLTPPFELPQACGDFGWKWLVRPLPELANAPLGLSILYLLRQTESEAPLRARELVARTKREIDDEALQRDLLELIETVIIHKLPRLSREEFQAMLQVHDIRESRVYQEAKEEGLKEGIEEGAKQERQRHLEEKLQGVAKLAALKIPPDDIAEILALDVEVVRTELAKNQT